MADINQVITLGIGTPASIKFFITAGLGISSGVVTGLVELSLRERWLHSGSLAERAARSGDLPPRFINSGTLEERG